MGKQLRCGLAGSCLGAVVGGAFSGWLVAFLLPDVRTWGSGMGGLLIFYAAIAGAVLGASLGFGVGVVCVENAAKRGKPAPSPFVLGCKIVGTVLAGIVLFFAVHIGLFLLQQSR